MLLALLVLLATQPLQASYCDMCAGQNTAFADMSHAEMQHTEMSHADMADTGMRVGMDHGGNSKAMDCCDDTPVDSDKQCADMAHCGACPAGNVAVSPSMAAALISTATIKLDFSSDPPIYRSSSPPFRPPIS